MLWAGKAGQTRGQQVQHQDLGHLSGEIWVFGGPYSNLQATEALVARADAACISASHLICTGDWVAYCADPVAVFDALNGRCQSIAGNMEVQLAANAVDCGCGFDEGSSCDLLSSAWYTYAQGQVTQAMRQSFGQMPKLLSFSHDGGRAAVIHGGASDLSHFLWPNSRADAFAHEISLIEAQIGAVDQVFCGHSGLAFQRQIGRVTWVNAGVIGMPPHDGRPATRFVRLRDGRAVIERLVYDASGAQRAMEGAGLPRGYSQALTTGMWPSQDILPPPLRR